MTAPGGVDAVPDVGRGVAGRRLARTRKVLTWGGIVTSGLAVLVLALPTRLHAWFLGAPRTDDITLESWANPATIDPGNPLTLLPTLAFLAGLATLVLAVLTLRRGVFGLATGLAGTGAAAVTVLAMVLSWALQGAYATLALPNLLLLPLAGTLLLTASVLHLVEVQRARVAARA